MGTAPVVERHNEPGYRADIDGLRAIAVLAVVGFHSGIRALAGGFAGVDVFFVISGYLITGIILRQLEAGRFSFAEFYARRINRILPSLIAVLAAVLVAGWVVLFPGEYQSLGKHIAGGATFTSNFILWSETNYFDSAEKPLLHLWSLGVEEQFYLVWPLMVWIAWKRRPALATMVVALLVVSFALNIGTFRSGQGIGAFYSPFTRFWEIMTGAFLAELEARRRSQARELASGNAAIRNGLSTAGVFFLAISLVATSQEVWWVVWREVLPVAGAAALIAGGRNTFFSRRVLSARALVLVGLISYPLYLWHWPLMVFGKLVNGGPLSSRGMLVVVSTAFVLAIATYRIVEIPIRFGAHKRRSASILLPALILLGVAGFMVQKRVLEPRVNGAAADRVQEALSDWTYPGARGQSPVGKSLVINRIPGDTTRRVVFIGDSHAEQYWPRMVELARKSAGRAPEVVFITYGGCSAFPNTDRAGISWHGGPFNCPEYYRRALAEVDRENAKSVVFASWWEINLGADKLLVLGGKRIPIGKTDSTARIAFSMLGDAVADLEKKGREVFLVASNPWDEAFSPRAVLPGRLPAITVRPPMLSIPRDQVDSISAFANGQLRAIAARTGATLIDPVGFFCDSVKCATVDSAGQPIYRDYNHMRASFARQKAAYIDAVVHREPR
ncbi:MAG TPA: acyltransferase family protein [Gemmatimonadaceae bacterium]|nr:acyltransferase family protein [Gemmatimonadaceae bacterium]